MHVILDGETNGNCSGFFCIRKPRQPTEEIKEVYTVKMDRWIGFVSDQIPEGDVSKVHTFE